MHSTFTAPTLLPAVSCTRLHGLLVTDVATQDNARKCVALKPKRQGIACLPHATGKQAASAAAAVAVLPLQRETMSGRETEKEAAVSLQGRQQRSKRLRTSSPKQRRETARDAASLCCCCSHTQWEDRRHSSGSTKSYRSSGSDATSTTSDDPCVSECALPQQQQQRVIKSLRC